MCRIRAEMAARQTEVQVRAYPRAVCKTVPALQLAELWGRSTTRSVGRQRLVGRTARPYPG